MTDYRTLWQFFGGYLNEDWPEEYGDDWTAVDAFVHDAPDEVDTFRAEIAALLVDHSDDDEVRGIVLGELSSCFLPEVNGWKYRDWLQALSDHAAKSLGYPRVS